jgi:hypothetical protein
MNASNYSSDEVAFPVLNAAEIRVAEKFGRRERLEAGRVLFEPGQQLVDLLVILDGVLRSLILQETRSASCRFTELEVLLGR